MNFTYPLNSCGERKSSWTKKKGGGGIFPLSEDHTSQTHWKVQCLKLTCCGYIFYSIVSINDSCCIPVHHIIIHRLRGSDLVSFRGTIIWTEVDVVICWWIVHGVTAGISNDIPSSIIPVMSKLVSEWVSYCLTTNNDKWAIGVLNTTLCEKVCQWLAVGQWFSPGTLTFSHH